MDFIGHSERHEGVPTTYAVYKKSSPQPAEEKIDLGERYRIERRLQQGGMGVVYLATQLHLERHVAVKVLSPCQRDVSQNLKEQFYREAATLARLKHPNVVTVHDYGQAKTSEMFLVMEYLDGLSLRDLVEREGVPSIDRVLEIGLQVARALREAHRYDVVHRDLKPENIMLVSRDEEDDAPLVDAPDSILGQAGNHVKVLDFGLARLFGEQPDPFDAQFDSVFTGSPEYMAPEQICFDTLDARTDLYALGGILYYLVSGKPPFEGKTTKALYHCHLQERPAALCRRDCPEDLEAIIFRCLEKQKEARYASANELITDIKQVYRAHRGRSQDEHSVVYPMTEDLERTARALLRGVSSPSVDAQNLTGPLGLSRGATNDVSLFRSMDLAVPTQSRLLVLPFVAVLVLGLLTGSLATWAVMQRYAQPEAQETSSVGFRETKVRFESDPSGARVSENGVTLGVTPFIGSFPRSSKAGSRAFVFSLDGYGDVRLESTMENAHAVLKARLVSGASEER